MSKGEPYDYVNREISWLHFNGRVLQEATDPRVPPFERLAFLGIFSSNLDEFFRVRVASLRSLLPLKKKPAGKLDFNPLRLLGQIQRIVMVQQEAFGQIFSGLQRELALHGIYLIDGAQATEGQRAFARAHFGEHVRPHLSPILLQQDGEPPFLKDSGLYLVTELWPKRDAGPAQASGPAYALTEVPCPPLPRFVTLPEQGPERYVLFLDDVIRLGLPALYPEHDLGASYAVKLSRDAELYLDEGDLEDEFAGSLAKLIKKSLSKRETGLPCRFLYDRRMPFALAGLLRRRFDLQDEDLVPGGRYHKLSDLMAFPRFGRDDLGYDPLPPLPHPELERATSVLEAIARRDHLLHFPYQRFDYVIRFLEEAAADPDVEEVWITLYRVAEDSAVVGALTRAAEQGKRVTAFVEAKARFDEARNLASAERMAAAGVRVLYSMPKLKVHAKIALVVRREGDLRRRYAYLGTGNFNEATARLYTDLALLTADAHLTQEVRRVFDFLTGTDKEPTFRHLLVTPFGMREAFYERIEREAARAQAGEEASMALKMNSLEDEAIIARLYEARRAGVEVRLVVRGICRLVRDVLGPSEPIRATSILDRFLEHARIFSFHSGGEEELYLASADWMTRNLSRRVEVAFPVYDERLRQEIYALLDLQLRDNTKARRIDLEAQNAYVEGGTEPVRAQLGTYRYYEAKLEGQGHAGAAKSPSPEPRANA